LGPGLLESAYEHCLCFVDDSVIVELKAVRQLEKLHEAQLLTYLKFTGLNPGLLLNFNVLLLRDGIKRLVNGL
jgi:GxxExxY protein